MAVEADGAQAGNELVVAVPVVPEFNPDELVPGAIVLVAADFEG